MSNIIPDRVLEEIRSRTSIVDVISSRITLKRSGAVYKACCPFHREKTPSFTVNPAHESFKCFGCGEGGDVFSFLMKHDGMTFTDAVKTLGERCGVEVEFSDDGGNAAVAKRLLALHAEIAEFYRRCLTKMVKAEAARAYLKSRDLPDEIAERFKIGYAPEGSGILEKFASTHQYTIAEMIAAGLAVPLERPRQGENLHDRFRGRLMFPICDTQGRVIAFSGRIMDAAKSPAKYVNSPETEIFKKSRVLYALDKAQRKIVSAPHREAIICEGQIDVIRCHACGFDRAVASQGTAFTEEHAKLLKRYADSAVLMFDQDAAGQKAAVRTGAILLGAGIPVRVARLTPGDDPDSFLRKNPPEAFQKVLDDSIGLVPFHVAYLQAQETDSKSEGAIGRIAEGVLQTVASCHNEIHKARMLQEAAELLRIPETALESELKGIEEAIKRQSESLDRREAARAEVSARGSATAKSKAAPSSSSFDNHVPFDEPMTYLEPEESFGDLGVSGAGASPAGKQMQLPNKTDLSVCELLVHNFYDNVEITSFLVEMLPEWLLPEGLCRRVVHAYYESFQTGTDKVIELQQTDKEANEFIGALAVKPNRAGMHETFFVQDLAHELVLDEWRRWCARRKAELEPKDGTVDTPDVARRRSDFMVSMRNLRRWDTGEPVIRVMLGRDAETATESTQPAAPTIADSGSDSRKEKTSVAKPSEVNSDLSFHEPTNEDDGPEPEEYIEETSGENEPLDY